MLSCYYLELISKELTKFTLKNEEKRLIDFNSALYFFEDEIVDFLQNAILCGEHYKKDQVQFVKQIKDSLIYIQGLCLATTVNIRFTAGAIHAENVRLMSAITVVQRLYMTGLEFLIEHVTNNLSAYNKGEEQERFNFPKLFDKSNIDDELFDSKSLQLKYKYEVFKQNIVLAYIDESLHCGLSKIDQLNFVKSSLEVLKRDDFTYKIISLLLNKIDFLEFKINFRIKHPRDHEKDSLTEGIPSIASTNIYFSIYQKSLLHYSDFRKKKIDELIITAESFNDSTEETFSLESFHHLRRIYRKKKDHLNEAKESVESLLKKLRGYLNSDNLSLKALCPLNQAAAKTTINILENVSLKIDLDIEVKKKYATILKDVRSYIMPNADQTIDVIKQIFTGKKKKAGVPFLESIVSRIKKPFPGSNIQDFYSNILFIEFLSKLLRHFKSYPEIIIDIDKNDFIKISIEDKEKKILEMIDYITEVCDEIVSDIIKQFRFTYTHKSMPVYSTIKDCHTESKTDHDQSYFIKSSYILPYDLSKMEAEIKSLEVLILIQKTAVKDTFEIALNQAEIKTSFADFEKKVKENELKAVQIVGIFVSIATFVLLSVKVLDGKSGLESFGIILATMACLFLFNLFIYILVLPQPNLGSRFLISSVKFLLFLAIPVILLYIANGILKDQNSNTQNQIKSIEEKVLDSSHFIKSRDNFNSRLDNLINKIKTDSINSKRYIDNYIIRKAKSDSFDFKVTTPNTK